MSDGAITDPSLNKSEHVDENISAKRMAGYSWDGSNWARNPAPLLGSSFDYIDFGTGATTDTLTFRTGGSGGTPLNTLTLTYTDSTKNTLVSIAKT